MPRNWVILALLILLFVNGSLLAQDAAQTPSPEVDETGADMANAGHIRVAHFSPDTPSVNIRIDGEVSATAGVSYPVVSEWAALPAGSYEVSVESEDGAPLEGAAASLNLPAGSWFTLALLGSSENGTLQVKVIEQDMSALTPGTSRVVFLNALEDAPSVNLLRDEVVYVTGLTYGNPSSINEDEGVFLFQVDSGGLNPVILAVAPETRQAESYYYLIAVVGTADDGDDADPQMIVVETDSAEIMVGAGALLPPGTIIEALAGYENAGDLDAAIENAGLTDLLSGDEQYTVFAPLDFNLSSLEADSEALADLVSEHIIEGEIMSQQLAEGGTLTTISGKTLTIRAEGDNIFINNAKILAVNIPATNGVIHLIDAVIIAPSDA